MLRFLSHTLQVIISIVLVTFIMVFFIVCFGTGVVGGFMLGCWEDVASLDLQKLEYKQDTQTWRQNLEVYSSVCEVQLQDTSVFLIDKLERIEYEKILPGNKGINDPGQYLIQLSGETGKQNGSIQLFTRHFDYPNLSEESLAKRIHLTVNSGKIILMHDDSGNTIRSFYLEPELIAEPTEDDTHTKRKIIRLVDMPTKLKDAFIAIEDRRFYQHSGIDVVRLVGAIKDFLGSGNEIGATSTLTQQLTRNVYLGTERNLQRKVREMLLAFRIEKQLSKDQILEGYLNYIDFGRHNHQQLFGVQKAAMAFFGKDVAELDYHECALLAAIPKGTTMYSPAKNPENARRRRDTVLTVMLNQKFITETEYNENRNQPIKVQHSSESSVKAKEYTAGHFIQHIKSELEKIPEIKDSLYNEGLKVYTTIDMSMQSVAVNTIGDHLRLLDSMYGKHLPNYDTNKENKNGIHPITNYLQAGLIAFVPQTGQVKAMVGGRDYFITDKDFKDKPNFNEFNRTLGTKRDPARRQPGSAFKPIVFAALMQEPSIVNPSTILVDEIWGMSPAPGQPIWYPDNYSHTFKGPLTVRDIIKRSINVPTVRAALETPINEDGLWEGINRIVKLTKRMGIDSPMIPTPALTLGASGMKVVELTAAYGVFANRGIRVEPSYVHYVVDSDGKPVYHKQPERTRVLDEKVAYQITSFLQSVIREGTGIRATRNPAFQDWEVAGKTGTTNENVDAWFVGYSTDLVVGVWVGLDSQRRNLKNYNEEGAKAALPIWIRFMAEAARGPKKKFPIPEGIEFWEIDKTTGLLRNKDTCPPENISNEPFIKGQEPTRICDQH
ncbi:MAG: PBP1A family penicillin-binding protein [Candidatus Poribacteria bacterium]|nr:PBP1A family penicillin-binding protein [Candidatus Poribacteria bacterium]